MSDSAIDLAILVGLSAAILLLFAVALRQLRRPGGTRESTSGDLGFDVAKLPVAAPPDDALRLHVYGTPVRLAVVVVAASGRGHPIPGLAIVPDLLENLVPGLRRVIEDHQSLIKVWPSQLSSQGFTHSFFNLLRLPGDRGKGTPWCSIAGKADRGDRPLLVGLVCCSAQKNSLSQITIQHEGQWLDVLRIQENSPT